MAEKNMIEYDGQEIRTNVTRKYSGEQTQTPIVGSMPCGSPQYEEENIEAVSYTHLSFYCGRNYTVTWWKDYCIQSKRNHRFCDYITHLCLGK